MNLTIMHTDDDVYVRVLVQGAHLQIAYTNACTKVQVHLTKRTTDSNEMYQKNVQTCKNMPTKMYNVYSHVVVEYYCMIKTIYNTHLNQSH